MNRLRKFWGQTAMRVAEHPLPRQRRAFASAQMLVRVYYGVTLYLLVSRLDVWPHWATTKWLVPLWPVLWVDLVGIPTAVPIIMTSALVAALLSSLCPEKRIARAFLFVSLLEYVAFGNSFGKIGHDWHSWLGISFFFIFLPDGKQLEGSRTQRQLYLTVFWGAQALMLGFYSLSGLWKVVLGVYQLWHGTSHTFAPEALAYQIANRLLQTHETSVIGSFIIDHPVVGWPLYLSAVYLQLFAFVAAFRPSLHRFWGLALIGFHVGSYFSLSVTFPTNVLWLVLLLVNSPVAPSHHSWRALLYDLPLVGWLAALVQPKQRGQGTGSPPNQRLSTRYVR